jgi:competence protein ComEA
MFERISKKIGFTQTEILVILFLSGLLLSGIVYVEFFKENRTDNKYIDYTKEDSLFYYYSNLNPEIDLEDTALISNLEIKKKVLELSDTMEYMKKDFASLGEKSININTVGINELTKLPGIGQKTAERILELRRQRGKFKRLEELMDVKGIGEVKFSKIEKYLYIH